MTATKAEPDIITGVRELAEGYGLDPRVVRVIAAQAGVKVRKLGNAHYIHTCDCKALDDIVRTLRKSGDL